MHCMLMLKISENKKVKSLLPQHLEIIMVIPLVCSPQNNCLCTFIYLLFIYVHVYICMYVYFYFIILAFYFDKIYIRLNLPLYPFLSILALSAFTVLCYHHYSLPPLYGLSFIT